MATKDIGSLRTRLSFEDEGSSQGLEGLRRDLKGLRSEMNLARSGGREYSNSLKGMREQSDILSRTLKTQQERVRELKHRYDESVKAKGEDNKQTRDLAAQYNNATAQMNRTELQLQRLNEEIRRQASPWTKLGENLDAAGDKLQVLGKGMTDFGKGYSMRVTAPIVASGIAVFKASMDYESAFAGVRKTVDATEEEFQALSDGIREMTKVLPASATEIAAVGEAAGQLGIETENILSFTRTMIDLGEATNMTADTAATEFARFANIVGMSQKDFDRLGSVVVDLGNNLATTEAEIVSMALRLAGAGAQIGLTEAEIMAFAGSLSSVGIAADAGGSAFSKVMVNMQLAAELGGEELKEFAKVSGMSAKEFKHAFENDAAGAMISFITGLSTAEERGMSAIAVLDEMGITEVRMRDALLRAAGASDLFTDSIALGSKAWEENTALTEEAAQRYATTESQLKIMWNRMKDVAITMGDALVPAVMSTLDAAEPLIEKIESGAQAFADMDEEQQRTILKFIALAAAIGPASIMLGGITTTAGGLLKVGGSVSKMLGARAGAGLIGRIGLMGLATGPVGIAVGTIGLLGGAIYLLSRDSEKLHDVNWELVESMQAEVDATDDLIAQYEELELKNRLTTDETLRYMDILSELKSADGAEAIKALKDEQADLLEKSGFTNGEMETFLGLNDNIIKKTPEITKAISDQGNAYVTNLDILKELNEEKRKELLITAERELLKALENETTLLERQKELVDEIKKTDTDITKNREERLKNTEDLKAEEEKLKALDEEVLGLRESMKDLDYESLQIAEGKLLALEHEYLEQLELVSALDEEKDILQSTYDTLVDKLNKKNDDLEITREEIQEVEQLKGEYEGLILAQVNITAAKGNGLKAIDEEIKKVEETKRKLEEQTDPILKNTEGYKDHVSQLDTQLGRLKDAQTELKNINELAGKTIYKDVIMEMSPSISQVNRDIAASVSKRVNITTGPVNHQMLGYADGTDHHPGGRFIAGEEGYELGRLGNRWEMLNFGMYDRPAGYEVFTHDETKDILKSLNRMPAYATGVSSPGEADRVVGQLNNQQQVQPSQPIVLEIHVTSEIDGRVAGQAVEKYVTEIQDRNQKVVKSFA